MGSKITDNQFEMHIFSNLPAEYDVAVNLLRRKILVVSLEELQADLRHEYDQFKARKNGGNNDNNSNDNNANGEEHALFAGECHHCGQYRHQIGACWVKDPSKKPSGRGYLRRWSTAATR
jgi:hypothetical protein